MDKEFYVSVDLYVSAKAAAALRKVSRQSDSLHRAPPCLGSRLNDVPLYPPFDGRTRQSVHAHINVIRCLFPLVLPRVSRPRRSPETGATPRAMRPAPQTRPSARSKVRRRRIYARRAGCAGAELVLRRVVASAEKASWLGIGRSSAGAGQWRPARCKLVEEEEGCLLNIYIDVSLSSACDASVTVGLSCFR